MRNLRWPDPWLPPVNLYNAPEQGRVENNMTYEERKEEAMKMTLEDLIGGYHSAIDTAENRKNTNISLQYLLDERHLQIEALHDTVQDLADERDKLLTDDKIEVIKYFEGHCAVLEERGIYLQKDNDELKKRCRRMIAEKRDAETSSLIAYETASRFEMDREEMASRLEKATDTALRLGTELRKIKANGA